MISRIFSGACQVPQKRNSPLAGQNHEEAQSTVEYKGTHRQTRAVCFFFWISQNWISYNLIQLHWPSSLRPVVSNVVSASLWQQGKELFLMGSAVRLAAWYKGCKANMLFCFSTLERPQGLHKVRLWLKGFSPKPITVSSMAAYAVFLRTTRREHSGLKKTF